VQLPLHADGEHHHRTSRAGLPDQVGLDRRFTQFTNTVGQVMAEVKSNATTISSFTVNWNPCTYPNGMYRWRYIKRYFTFASNAASHNLDIRLYYSNEEMYGVSHPTGSRSASSPSPAAPGWIAAGSPTG